jgi:hypothetical protein
LTVKYSGSKQKYKKSAVKLTIRATEGYQGKVTIYDGKKKLKTIRVSSGNLTGAGSGAGSTYVLPKSLKKGTHKITVKFTATGAYKTWYKDKTSKVKKITVKK